MNGRIISTTYWPSAGAVRGHLAGDKPLIPLNKVDGSIDIALPTGYIILQLATEGSFNFAILCPRQPLPTG